MPKAARITDLHRCPIHPPNAIVSGSGNVSTGYLRAARVGDALGCGALITNGSSNVHINGREAARLHDPTSHGGAIASGCGSVTIGESAQAGALRSAANAAAVFADDCDKHDSEPEEIPAEAELSLDEPPPADELLVDLSSVEADVYPKSTG